MTRLQWEKRRRQSQENAMIGAERREKLQESRRVSGRPGMPVLSKDGADLKAILEGLGSGIKVFPNIPGAKYTDPWALHVNGTATGFQVCFRINGQGQECITVNVIQGLALRRKVEEAINAWWANIMPSELIVPFEEL